MNINIYEMYFCKILYGVLSVAFVFIAIDPNFTAKLINASGLLALLFFVFSFSRLNINTASWGIFWALLILGIINLSYYVTYKHSDTIYANAYRGYLEAGKLAFFGSFIFVVLNSKKGFLNKKFILNVALIGQALLISRAFYQGLYLSYQRIPLSAMGGAENASGAATIAAYMIIFSGIYTTIVFVKSELKHKFLFALCNVVLIFIAVVMTGTRGAIIAFPCAIIIALIFKYHSNIKYLFKMLLSLIVVFSVCAFLFHKQIEMRMNSIHSDIVSYSQKDSETSIGSRLAMIKAGIDSANKNFLWQSLEVRGKKIQAMVQKDHSLSGATEYLDVHMHNEYAEALSSKGILGVLAMLFIYAAIFVYAYKMKQPLILALLISLIMLGFGDVLMHAKPIPASWILSLILSCCYLNICEKK